MKVQSREISFYDIMLQKLGAGSVVTKVILENLVAVGNAARVVKNLF